MQLSVKLSLDHPGTPLAWLPVVRCDCQHQDFIAAVKVHDRKWKAFRENSASAVPVRCAHIWEFSRNRGLVKSNAHQFSRRRTSANTSSAGMSLAAPASISAIRIRISSSPAASTSSSGSCTEARSSSAKRTRSAGGSVRACELSSSMRVAILISWRNIKSTAEGDQLLVKRQP